MTINELIYNFNNNSDFRNELQLELKNKKSKYKNEEIEIHKKEVFNLQYKLMLDMIVNEIYPIVGEIKIK